MVDEKKIIRRFEKMIEKTPRFAGLKKEALLEEIVKILREEAVNEDIRQRIQRAIGPQDDARAKRIYISGKMTGLEEQEIAENFKKSKTAAVPSGRDPDLADWDRLRRQTCLGRVHAPG